MHRRYRFEAIMNVAPPATLEACTAADRWIPVDTIDAVGAVAIARKAAPLARRARHGSSLTGFTAILVVAAYYVLLTSATRRRAWRSPTRPRQSTDLGDFQMRITRYAVLVLGGLAAISVLAGEPPSRPTVDAPELARLGDSAVGVRTITLVNRDQPDVLAFDAATNTVPLRDRPLTVDIWYPAQAKPGAKPETYAGELPSEGAAPAAKFTIPGLAVRNAIPTAGRHPLVILSHGYSNVTVALSWLTENLASNGYVVAAIRHNGRTHVCW